MGAPIENSAGLEALKRVVAVLPTAVALHTQDQFGSPVIVEPATVWGGKRMFVTDLGGTVAFTSGDKLYTQATADFVRDTYLMALGDGAKQAEWLVGVAQTELTFLMALVGTLAGGIGLIAAVGTAIGKLMVFLKTHEKEVAEARKHLNTVVDSYHFIALRCPKFGRLLAKLMGGFALKSAAEGVTAGDVAYFLGKLIGGVGAAPELVISAFVKSLVVALALTAIIHGPGMTAHGAPAHAKKIANDFRQNGVNIPEGDILLVETERCAQKVEVRAKFTDMVDAARRAQPVVEQLARALSAQAK